VKIFISESDRQNAFRLALNNIARFYNIPNWETEQFQSIYDSLKDKPIFNELKEYFKAYNNWFAFYERIKKIEQETGKEHYLTNEERHELSGLIQKRKDTLDTLQNKFDELQFEKFKKDKGLDDVKGIIF
jgi:hypothetical protein